MKKLLTVLLVIIMETSFCQEVTFIENDWSEAKKISQEMKRPIFVFATIKGCGPCIEMERKVFSDPEVKKVLEERFVNLRIDGQRGEGKDLVKEYAVPFYPTLLYFDSAQLLINKTCDNPDKKNFLRICRLALNPQTRTPALTKRFVSQKVDTTFLKNYIRILELAGYNTGPAIDSLYSKKNMLITFQDIQYLKSLNSCKSSFLDFVIKNRKSNPNLDTAPYINGVFLRTANRLFQGGEFTIQEYNALKSKIAAAKIYGWEDELNSIEDAYNKYTTKN